MVLTMKVNGTPRLSKDMVEDTKYGVMEVFMKDIGRVIKQMVVED